MLNGPLLILHPPPNLSLPPWHGIAPHYPREGTLFPHAQKPPSSLLPFFGSREGAEGGAISIESGQKEEKHLPPPDHGAAWAHDFPVHMLLYIALVYGDFGFEYACVEF